MKNPIQKNQTQGEIKKIEAEDLIASFYGLDPIGTALRASDFDLMEEVQTLIQHVRDPDPKVSLPALRHFRALLKEIATANGMIGQVHQTQMSQDAEGTVRRTMSTSALLSNLRSHNVQDQEKDEGQEERPHRVILPQDGSTEEPAGPNHEGSSGSEPPEGDGPDDSSARGSSIGSGSGGT